MDGSVRVSRWVGSGTRGWQAVRARQLPEPRYLGVEIGVSDEGSPFQSVRGAGGS